MGRIVEIRDHDGPKNRFERVITKGASCYYKIRWLLVLHIVATFIANFAAHLFQNGNLYYKKGWI